MPSQLPLALLLERGIGALWPRRTQQELLLDLGERKGWDSGDFEQVVREVASWLHRELGLPEQIPENPPDESDVLSWARAFGSEVATGDAEAGVARWAVALGPALGVSGKTLANGVGHGLRSDRSDHRWLGVLYRLAHGEAPLSAWSFHARTGSSVAAELGRLAGTSLLDAGDALLVMSLLALWQRRRPPEQARANRGVPRSRRDTPKPLAALQGALAAPGQVRHLSELANRLAPDGGRGLLLLVADAGLTEAHLAPHRARHGEHAPADGEEWLRAVERLLDTHAMLRDVDRQLLRFRIDRMRTWRDKKPLNAPELDAVREPYVAASLALEAVRSGEPRTRMFSPNDPGLLMLLPLLRTRHLLVTS